MSWGLWKSYGPFGIAFVSFSESDPRTCFFEIIFFSAKTEKLHLYAFIRTVKKRKTVFGTKIISYSILYFANFFLGANRFKGMLFFFIMFCFQQHVKCFYKKKKRKKEKRQ